MNICVAIGDSITQGSACLQDWPTRLRPLLGSSSWAIGDLSRPGQGSATIVSNASTFYNDYSWATKKVAIIEAGTNDKATLTGQQIYDNVSPLLDAICTAVWDLLIVQRPTPFGSTSGWTSGQQTVMDDYWALLEAYSSATATIYYTQDNHPWLSDGDEARPRLQETPIDYRLSTLDGNNDGLHPNDASCAARAIVLRDIIAAQIGL